MWLSRSVNYTAINKGQGENGKKSYLWERETGTSRSDTLFLVVLLSYIYLLSALWFAGSSVDAVWEGQTAHYKLFSLLTKEAGVLVSATMLCDKQP